MSGRREAITRRALLFGALLAGGCGARPTAAATDAALPVAIDARMTDAAGAPVAGPPPRPMAPTNLPPPDVRVTVSSTPVRANVYWGKRSLGLSPVTLKRPRDSGPIDFVLRANGFFPLHVRGYTLRDDSVHAQLTKLTDRMTLLGAKEDLGDGGVSNEKQ